MLQKQIPVLVEEIRAGLANVNWPGRLHVIQRANGQKILLDGAHNAAGAKALRKAVKHHFNAPKLTLILGVLEDKDWRLFAKNFHRLRT